MMTMIMMMMMMMMIMRVCVRCSSQERLGQPPGTGHQQAGHQPGHQDHLTIGHFDSNDSNPSLLDAEEGRRSPSFRPRSRSLR